MLNRSSPGATAILIKLNGKTTRNSRRSGISSVLLEQLFQELPSFCLETFKCLNEFIVLHVGTESNIVGMIITGFVNNLFIVDDFFGEVDQNSVRAPTAFGETSLRDTQFGSFAERMETACWSSQQELSSDDWL